MPLPIAVPRCSWKRSIAATRSSRLCVGGCTTDAVRGERDDADRACRAAGRRRTPCAASCAAAMRLGLHVGGAHAARHVHRQDDGLVLRRQRDHRRRPRDRDDQQRQRQQEQERRHVAAEALPGAHRVPDQRQAGVAQRRPSSCAAAAADTRATTQRHQQQQPQHLGPEERHRAASEVLRQHAAGRELAAPLAQIGEAQDRIDQVVVGRELERVDAGVAKRRAQARPRARSAAAAKRLRKPRSWVSTNSCSPVSASWIDEQAEVGQLHLQRIEQAHRDHLVALREMRRAALPSRAR